MHITVHESASTIDNKFPPPFAALRSLRVNWFLQHCIYRPIYTRLNPHIPLLSESHRRACRLRVTNYIKPHNNNTNRKFPNQLTVTHPSGHSFICTLNLYIFRVNANLVPPTKSRLHSLGNKYACRSIRRLGSLVHMHFIEKRDTHSRPAFSLIILN